MTSQPWSAQDGDHLLYTVTSQWFFLQDACIIFTLIKNNRGVGKIATEVLGCCSLLFPNRLSTEECLFQAKT